MPLLTSYSKLVVLTVRLNENSGEQTVMSGSETASSVNWDPEITRVTNSRFPLNDFRSFNSPFEVLFNFPSGYLFAIDLSSIFSHGWRLPPYLRSTPKERDS